MHTTMTVSPGTYRQVPRYYLSIVGRYGYGPRHLFAGLTLSDAIATAVHFARQDTNPAGSRRRLSRSDIGGTSI